MSEAISVDMIKELRAITGAGPIKCKEALQETGGDIQAAVDLLRKRGIAGAAKKAGRETREGTIGSYIHLGARIGVMVKLLCETSFVAQNQEFKDLAKDLCVHITAQAPTYLRREDVPQSVLDHEREILAAQSEGKHKEAVEKILAGKLEKFYEETCLLDQKYYKDPSLSIQEYLATKIAKTGENIVVDSFVRMTL